MPAARHRSHQGCLIFMLVSSPVRASQTRPVPTGTCGYLCGQHKGALRNLPLSMHIFPYLAEPMTH